MPQGTGKRTPLVILGLDVGDPYDIQKWASQGYLPTIAGIMAKGSWGRIAGPEMCSEQGLWFAMFNGVSRGKHGYYYFRQLTPGTYNLEEFTGLSTQEKPFWAHLADSKVKVAQLDVPDACPVPRLPGWQLLDWAIHNIHEPFPPETVPAEVMAEVREIFGPRMIINESLNSDFATSVQIFRNLMRRIDKKTDLCLKMLDRHPVDLFVTVFAETHTGTHQLWKYRPESPRIKGLPEEHELTHAIRDLYQAVDRAMGRILAQLPPDANVFILSSSGMEDHYPAIGIIESFCRRLGYQATPEPSKSLPLTPLAIARRFMPENLRIAISRHLPRQMQERMVASLFRDGTDWSRTKAFHIPAHYNSFLRVNLKGREPQGIVADGAEHADVVKRMEDDLNLLIDPVTNQAAVRDVFHTADYEPCGHLHPALPELVVKWKPCQHFLSRLHHPKAELTQPIPGFYRDSEHSEVAFLAAAGPDISVRGNIGDVDLLDLAPTFLAALGQSKTERMDGNVIPGLLASGIAAQGSHK
jgi:predicted AlkP superfamily phosphohydrolase/phosphomutase